MAVWSKCIITDVGKALIADCQANDKVLHFTNCKTSSHNYYNSDIAGLTDLEDIKQTKAISEKYVENNNTVKFTANIDNNQLTTGYQLYTYGLYANNGGSDVLLFVGATDTPDTVPTVSEAPWQAIINTHITINNSPEITIQVNPAANATIGYVDSKVTVLTTYIDNKVSALETSVTQDIQDLSDNKLDKRTTTGLRAYTHNGTTQSDMQILATNTANTIVQRDTNKYIKASTPVGKNDECVVNKGNLNSVTEVLISKDDSKWTFNSTTNLYNRTIDSTEVSALSNMYNTYTGTKAATYKIATGSSLATIESIEEAYSHIKYIISNNGSITIYADELLEVAITLLLYGL